MTDDVDLPQLDLDETLTTDDVTGPEDPRVHPGVCGITTMVGRFEFICVKEPHDREYRRRKTDANHTGYVSGTGAHPERPDGVRAAPADRHYFVRRWPNREG